MAAAFHAFLSGVVSTPGPWSWITAKFLMPKRSLAMWIRSGSRTSWLGAVGKIMRFVHDFGASPMSPIIGKVLVSR